MAAGLNILVLLPEVAAIGQRQLQQYCDEWCKRPIAKEFGCRDLLVDAEPLLTVNLDLAVARKHDDERWFLPIDEILGYVIDQHFSDPSMRRELHLAARQTWRRLAEQSGQCNVVMAGRSGLLWLQCKNPSCGVWLETSQRAIEGQSITCPPVPVTCPECGHLDRYDGTDLKLRLDA
jgi:hypothetical protein